MKTTSCLPIALLLWLIAIPSGGRAQCGDGVWSPCEFCGKDAWSAVIHAEMNHDCVVDVIDLGLFVQDFGDLGNFSGDFIPNGKVDLQDFAVLATCFCIHPQVAPCDPCNEEPVACGGTVRVTFAMTTADLDEITLDPEESRSFGLITENTQGMAGFVGCVTTSSNVVIDASATQGILGISGSVPGGGRPSPRVAPSGLLATAST